MLVYFNFFLLYCIQQCCVLRVLFQFTGALTLTGLYIATKFNDSVFASFLSANTAAAATGVLLCVVLVGAVLVALVSIIVSVCAKNDVATSLVGLGLVLAGWYVTNSPHRYLLFCLLAPLTLFLPLVTLIHSQLLLTWSVCLFVVVASF